MLRELDETLQYNMDVIAQSSTVVDRSLLRLEQQIDEGALIVPDRPLVLGSMEGIWVAMGECNPKQIQETRKVIQKPEAKDRNYDLGLHSIFCLFTR